MSGIADRLSNILYAIHRRRSLEDASVSLIVEIRQHVRWVTCTVQTCTVVGIGHDGRVAIRSGDLGRVRDQNGAPEQTERRVEIVVDEVHEVGGGRAGVDAVNGAVERGGGLVVWVFPVLEK